MVEGGFTTPVALKRDVISIIIGEPHFPQFGEQVFRSRVIQVVGQKGSLIRVRPEAQESAQGVLQALRQAHLRLTSSSDEIRLKRPCSLPGTKQDRALKRKISVTNLGRARGVEGSPEGTL